MIEFLLIHWWHLILIILLTWASAAAYRGGGSDNVHARWLRQAGVGLAVALSLAVWFGFHWSLVLVFGLSWAESTYFKKKGTDAQWYNWLLVGLIFALVPLPWVLTHLQYLSGYLLRTVIIIPLTSLLSSLISDVDWEEGLRGGIQVFTIPLLLIKLF